MSTGWRGLIKNTFQKQPQRLTQNIHCLLLTHSCASPHCSFYHFIISSQMLIWSISCLSVSQSLEVISVLWLLKHKVSLLHFHHFNTSSIVSFFLNDKHQWIFSSLPLNNSMCFWYPKLHCSVLIVTNPQNCSNLLYKQRYIRGIFYTKALFREPLSFLYLLIQPFHFNLFWNTVKLHTSVFLFFNFINIAW